MDNTRMHVSEQSMVQDKCKFTNVEEANIAPFGFKTKTRKFLDDRNKAVNNESLNIRDDSSPDVSLNKTNQTSALYFEENLTDDAVAKGEQKIFSGKSNILRLFIKNGEFVYAHPRDIIMIESCDHLVKVHLVSGDKVKKAVRHNTLKDFLSHLPPNQFMRIGRFCAINLRRLSGGSFNDQTFEFDFNISIKLQHAISSSAFNSIGK